MFKSIPLLRLVFDRSKHSLPIWTRLLLSLFIFASLFLINVVSQPVPVNAQASLDSEDANTYLPFMLGPPPPTVYDWGVVTKMSWSPDGSHLASGLDDGTARIWDVASGEEVISFEGLTDGVESMRWSPDGSRLSSISSDRTVRIWDVPSGEEVGTPWQYGPDDHDVSLSPDGSQLVSRSFDSAMRKWYVRVWDVASGEEVSRGTSNVIDVLGWSSYGQVAYVTITYRHESDPPLYRLYVWDVASGKREQIELSEELSTNNVSWSQDGSQLRSGLCIWDLASVKKVSCLENLDHTDRLMSWSPSGNHLASGSTDGIVRIWDATSGEEVSRFEGHTDRVRSVSWSPDGSQVASGSSDGTVRIWDVLIAAPHDDPTEPPAVPEPSIQLLKVGTLNDTDADGMIEVDDTITYSFTVRNSGNVTLFCISITDTLVDVRSGIIAPLEPGDSITLSAVYVLTQADIANGRVVSSALVSSEDINGSQIKDTSDDPNNLDDIDTDGNGDPDDPTVVTIERMPSIVVKKIGNFTDENGDGAAQAGETISYVFVVQNTGNAELTNVVVTDTILTVMGDPVELSLAARVDNSTFSALYTITEDDIAALDTIAVDGIMSETTARGTDPTGGIVEGYSDYSTQSSLLPSVYHWGRAHYVTDLVDLAPFEAERWGRGRIANVAYSPTGNQLAVATNLGIWVYRLDNPDNGRLLAHTNGASSVSWSPDETQLVSNAVDDSLIYIWDVTSGEVISSLEGHLNQVNSVSWSPDGSQIASLSGDGTVRIWDAVSGAEVSIVNQGNRIHSVSWSPDSSQLALGLRYGEMQLWDVVSGKEVSARWHDVRWHQGLDVLDVSWSPLGNYLASTTSDRGVSIWNAAISTPVLTTYGSTSWSPNGRHLASSSYGGTVRIWDVATRKRVSTLSGHVRAIAALNWSPDGSHITSTSINDIVQIWDVASGENITHLLGHMGRVWNVSWSPDGSKMASASGDAYGNPFYDAYGEPFYDDHIGYDGMVQIWDVASGEEVSRLDESHTDSVSNMSWSPDGTQVASVSGDFSKADDTTVRIWDVATGEEVIRLEVNSSEVNSVSWSPDGNYLASAASRTVRIWDVTNGEEVSRLQDYEQDVNSVSWSPDSSQVVIGSDDSTIRIWDAASGAEVSSLSGHTGGVDSVSWSPDGSHLASGSDDNTIRIWDVASGEVVSSLSGRTEGFDSVSWSPDGSRIAFGSWRTVRIWDVVSGEEVRRFEGHSDRVTSVSWSPDGSQVMSSSEDGTVRIWNVE